MGQRGVSEAGVKLGLGGFALPAMYSEDKSKVIRLIKSGQQSLIELSRWSTADDFIAHILKAGFFEFTDKTYPSPRKKTEVPLWFLISAQLVLCLYNGTNYSELKTFLKSGSILSRVGFNVGKRIGFNDKNKFERKTACDQDTVRKFFKDSEPGKINDWFCSELQKWFLKNSAIDTDGIFILDQSHLVVPNNENYKDAVLMPVDEHG